MLNYFFSLPFFTQIGLAYIVAINIVTFFYFGIDKIQSRNNRRRISEKTLWFLTGIGGSIGALLGMHYFRHKTKKTSFQAVIVLIICVHVFIVFQWILPR